MMEAEMDVLSLSVVLPLRICPSELNEVSGWSRSGKVREDEEGLSCESDTFEDFHKGH